MHICFTLLVSQVLGSIATICARAFAPNRIGPGPISPDITAGASALGNAWFWIALIFQLIIWWVCLPLEVTNFADRWRCSVAVSFCSSAGNSCRSLEWLRYIFFQVGVKGLGIFLTLFLYTFQHVIGLWLLLSIYVMFWLIASCIGHPISYKTKHSYVFTMSNRGKGFLIS
jgi:hypothetical protein